MLTPDEQPERRYKSFIPLVLIFGLSGGVCGGGALLLAEQFHSTDTIVFVGADLAGAIMTGLVGGIIAFAFRIPPFRITSRR